MSRIYYKFEATDQKGQEEVFLLDLDCCDDTDDGEDENGGWECDSILSDFDVEAERELINREFEMHEEWMNEWRKTLKQVEVEVEDK